MDGVTVRRVPAVPKGGDQLLAPSVLRHVRTGGWDLVHVQCYHTFVAPLAMAAAARSRIPYVLTFHGGGHTLRHRNALRRYQLRGIRPLLARAGALIATAEWEIEHYSALLGLPPEKFVLIPNGGDLPRPPAGAVDVEGTLIVSIGRVERFKGHLHAIAALPHVLREIPDARREPLAAAVRAGSGDPQCPSRAQARGQFAAQRAAPTQAASRCCSISRR